jgi:DNA-directed RNA polymerase subunit RPC12/RpoP
MMPSEWHYYVCTRCLATLVIGGQSKGVICPGCDQPMDEMEATSG